MRRRTLIHKFNPSKLRLKGKFIDESTEENWWYEKDGEQIAIPVNPTTKEFDIELVNHESFERIFAGNQALEKIYEFPAIHCSSLLKAFNNCQRLTTARIYLHESNVTDMTEMFYFCPKLTKVEFIALTPQTIGDTKSMFQSCAALTDIDLSILDTQFTTNMFNMFSGCRSLKALDLSNVNTQAVTNMQTMFYDCQNLISINMKFNNLSLDSARNMFNGCVSLLTLDLSSFSTPVLTDASNMFWNCTSLQYLDLSSFTIDTSKNPNLSGMFKNVDSLQHIKCLKEFAKNISYYTSLPSIMSNLGDCEWEIIDS